MTPSGFDPTAPIEAARTPPSSWYTDAGVLRAERERVFAPNWVPVARRDELEDVGPGPGAAFLAVERAGHPLVVLREPDGRLSAFHAVCRHHGAELVTGCGRLEQLVCPYHGWTYDRAGALVRAPHASGLSDLAALGLRRLAVDTWGPYVFVCEAPAPLPLRERLAPLEAALPQDDLARLRFVTRRRWKLACNWKVFVDNYLDGGYHVAHLHAGLAGTLALGDYRIEVHDRVSLQRCAGAGGRRIGEGAVYAFLHPAMMLNRYGPVLDVNLVRPIDERRTEVVFDFFFEPGLDEAFVTESLRTSERVQQEDVAISESVQRGLASPAYEQGRYAPRLEVAAHAFHRDLHAELSAWA